MIKNESLFAENVISARRLFFAKKEKNKLCLYCFLIVDINKNTEKNFGILKNINCLCWINKRKYLQIKQKFVKENDVIQKKD